LKNRITTIILDFGGVLSLPQDPDHLKVMEGLCRLPHERFMPLYKRERLELDRGTLSTGDYWGRILAEAGVTPSPELISRIDREDCLAWTQMNARVLAWTGELRGAGYRTAILSNMPTAKLVFMREGDAFRWLDDFDACVWSCDHLRVKPEPALYRICLERLGEPPEACIFLDDVQVNVEGARALGINGEVFRSAAETAPLLAGTWGLPVRSLMEGVR
jgi:putative hydrolase of the HAD superfamily